MPHLRAGKKTPLCNWIPHAVFRRLEMPNLFFLFRRKCTWQNLGITSFENLMSDKYNCSEKLLSSLGNFFVDENDKHHKLVEVSVITCKHSEIYSTKEFCNTELKYRNIYLIGHD